MADISRPNSPPKTFKHFKKLDSNPKPVYTHGRYYFVCDYTGQLITERAGIPYKAKGGEFRLRGAFYDFETAGRYLQDACEAGVITDDELAESGKAIGNYLLTKEVSDRTQKVLEDGLNMPQITWDQLEMFGGQLSFKEYARSYESETRFLCPDKFIRAMAQTDKKKSRAADKDLQARIHENIMVGDLTGAMALINQDSVKEAQKKAAKNPVEADQHFSVSWNEGEKKTYAQELTEGTLKTDTLNGQPKVNISLKTPMDIINTALPLSLATPDSFAKNAPEDRFVATYELSVVPEERLIVVRPEAKASLATEAAVRKLLLASDRRVVNLRPLPPALVSPLVRVVRLRPKTKPSQRRPRPSGGHSTKEEIPSGPPLPAPSAAGEDVANPEGPKKKRKTPEATTNPAPAPEKAKKKGKKSQTESQTKGQKKKKTKSRPKEESPAADASSAPVPRKTKKQKKDSGPVGGVPPVPPTVQPVAQLPATTPLGLPPPLPSDLGVLPSSQEMERWMETLLGPAETQAQMPTVEATAGGAQGRADMMTA